METAATSDDASGADGRLLTDPRLLAVLFSTSTGILVTQGVPPALPAIGAAFTVPDARLGLVMTAFLLPTSLTVPVAGALADAYGRRPVLLLSLVGFGTAGVATAAAGSFATVLALRVVQGVAFAGITPLTIAILGDLYDGTAGATAQGFRTSSHGIANAISPALAGLLAGLFWGYPFLLYGLAFPAAALVFFFLPETAPSTGGRGPSTLAERVAGLRTYLRALLAEFRSPTLAVLVAGIGTQFFVKYTILTFVPLFAIREFGASSLVGGALLSVFGVTRTLVAPFAGRVSARFSRPLTLFLALAFVVAGLALVGLAAGVPWLAVAIVVFSVGDGIATPFFHDTISALPDDARRGGVVSVMNTGKTGSASVSPAVFGVVLAAAGFSAVYFAAAGFAVVYAAVAAVALRGRADVLAALDA